MDNSKRNSGNNGMGFCGVLTIVFIVLKLTEVIDWSWVWVLSPTWISMVLTIILLVIFAIIEMISNKRYKTNRSKKLKW